MEHDSEVLIAVDGSPEADGALEVGLELASARGVGVTLLHVDPAAAAAAYDEDPLKEPSEERILDLDPVLRRAAHAATARGIAVHLKLVSGPGDRPSEADVAAAIEGVAIARSAGLVVVGSRGHGAFSSAVLGSVSQDLLRETDRPVVVVRDPRRS